MFSIRTIRKSLRISLRKALEISAKQGFAELPIAVMSAALIGTVIVTSAAGYNLYDSAAGKVSQLRMARALADDEAERIRSAGYDDVVKIEKPNGKLSNGYVKEVALGKEYREDIGNSVLKHKPVTIKVYDSEASFFPLVSVKTEKVSRWYKSGTFDKSNNGIYDETGEQHKGSIKKTGNGTGYVFLKKGAKVNGDVEIYDETNGDIYISNSIGKPGEKTVIRHVGPSTGSGYIRLAESCTINGTVTLENSSNGGMIIETAIPRNAYIAKLGSGTGFLRFSASSHIGQNVKVTNSSSGPIVVNDSLMNDCHLTRSGASDDLLSVDAVLYGTVGIDMIDAGKVTLTGYYYAENASVVHYSSPQRKSLSVSGNAIAGNLYIENNSNGKVIADPKTTDGSRFVLSGSGTGYFSLSCVLNGTAYLVNETPGYISMSRAVDFPAGKTIKKTGGGSGYLAFYGGILKGDFTLDSDWSGEIFAENWDEYAIGLLRKPVFADGAYLYYRGASSGRSRLFAGLQVLGRLNVYASTTNKSWDIGNYLNASAGYVDAILKAGYSITL